MNKVCYLIPPYMKNMGLKKRVFLRIFTRTVYKFTISVDNDLIMFPHYKIYIIKISRT